MKYKVGDKVRVRSELEENRGYGGKGFNHTMSKLRGEVVTISKVLEDSYKINECDYYWSEIMFEPVESELSAEEAIKWLGSICGSRDCTSCPIKKINTDKDCNQIRVKNPEKVVEIIKQYKAEHEKKPIETEWSWWIEIMDKKSHALVHEEKLNAGDGVDYQAEKIYKNYISEHDGEYYLVKECRYTAKE